MVDLSDSDGMADLSDSNGQDHSQKLRPESDVLNETSQVYKSFAAVDTAFHSEFRSTYMQSTEFDDPMVCNSIQEPVTAIVGDRFLAQGITFQNTSGAANHQAVALRVGSDLSAFYQCGKLKIVCRSLHVFNLFQKLTQTANLTGV
ncbi:pectin methylesterase 2 [Artemisia annua]|uniref:Pectin methylesterase 2 n=1 Tax=Artemisia annua TaxID=35608 RepID=A0A2U1L816_ARTAN|nr:pectin methylesterase 2 [Artemisia annua]